MKEVRQTPYSYSSKASEASEAAKGRDVYVIEVRENGKIRSYALGYRYRATEKFRPAGGGLWKDEFKFKNSATPGEPAIGVYFEPFVELSHPTVIDWLTTKQPGMAEIPQDVLAALQAIEANSTAYAKHFA
jgi:hypothetical protein